MNEMPYYMVSHFSVKDPATFQQYPPLATPILSHYGGTLLSLTGLDGLPARTVIEGTPQHVGTALVEWDSQEAFERWYRSPEYQAVIGLRTASTDGWVIGAPALPPPPQ
jgi:uncharacterized protein (DUF1330 family)